MFRILKFTFYLIFLFFFLIIQITAARAAEDPVIDKIAQTQCRFQINTPIKIDLIKNIQKPTGKYSWWWHGDWPPTKTLPTDQIYDSANQTLSITIPASENNQWGSRTFCINKTPSMVAQDHNCLLLTITNDVPTDISCPKQQSPANPKGEDKIPGLDEAFNANPTPKFTSLSSVLSGILNIALYAAAFLAFIFLVWGALAYITSQGQKENLAKARARLTWAIIGLIVVVLAFAIAKFVGEILVPRGGLPF